MLRLADENRSWGYMRIAGEITKLGRKASASTVRRILISHHRLPAPRRGSPTWSEFLAAEAKAIVACDFFTVDSVLGRTYHMLFFIEHQTRKVSIAGVARHTTGAWVTQRARELVWSLPPLSKFLIRDRDAKFTASFDAVFLSEEIATIKTPVQTPQANAICETWIETVRSEVLDWVIVLSRRHLEAFLSEYVEHYNVARPHRSLGHDPPEDGVAPEVSEVDEPIELTHVRRRDRLGGLIHEYDLAA